VTDQAVVSLHGVTVRRGGTTALAGISLTIRSGERVALVGPSGAGKSTLLHVINGSIPPTSGRVEVFGADPSSLSGTRLAALLTRIGTVYQDLALVGPLRVIHNVNAGRLGSWSLGRALRSLVRPVDVTAAKAVLARLGLEDKLWIRTDRLSGGEQQRVALARLLVQDAELILADEPIASLDPARGREVLELFCGIARQDHRTLIVSLHAFDLALEMCDRVIGLREGRVVIDAAPENVEPAMARSLYDLGRG
jgi:phosphonate transport system ATP-binding protein